MEIHQADFVSSHDRVSKCPPPAKPEFAFIGRSNVGKSSLINMLTQRKDLAKTSGRPGKTQTINHYLINNQWYLVDLPGYGYASASRDLKQGWSKMIEHYLLTRENLYCLFILLDARHPLQAIDASFIQWAGHSRIPICLVLTKADKLSKSELSLNRRAIEDKLLHMWDELPPLIISSATKKTGREEIIEVIETALAYKN
jgi:GTP-binding protein